MWVFDPLKNYEGIHVGQKYVDIPRHKLRKWVSYVFQLRDLTRSGSTYGGVFRLSYKTYIIRSADDGSHVSPRVKLWTGTPIQLALVH